MELSESTRDMEEARAAAPLCGGKTIEGWSLIE